MTSQWSPAQERGLLLLIGIALLASGLGVYRSKEPPAEVSGFSTLRPIVLSNVTVVVPEFVEPQPVNVNTAGLDELISLDGIGPALAGRIIEHREEQGPFTMLDDLLQVSGIGPQTLDGLRDQATVVSGRPES